MARVISIIEWRRAKGLVPFHFATEQDRRDYERERKQISDEELYRRIMMRGASATDSDSYKKFLSLSDHLDRKQTFGESTPEREKLRQQIIDTTKSF